MITNLRMDLFEALITLLLLPSPGASLRDHEAVVRQGLRQLGQRLQPAAADDAQSWTWSAEGWGGSAGAGSAEGRGQRRGGAPGR